jgi:hypothetical protein
MAPHGQKQKRAEDKRDATVIAIESAKNSTYNICTPMYNAQHVRIHHPITLMDDLYSVNDPAFYDVFKDLCQKGLDEKLFAEIKSFADKIDPAWSNIYDKLTDHVAANQES